jgi:hypothetical protein
MLIGPRNNLSRRGRLHILQFECAVENVVIRDSDCNRAMQAPPLHDFIALNEQRQSLRATVEDRAATASEFDSKALPFEGSASSKVLPGI